MLARFRTLSKTFYQHRFKIGTAAGATAVSAGIYYFGVEHIIAGSLKKQYYSTYALGAKTSIYQKLSPLVMSSLTQNPNLSDLKPTTLENWSNLIVTQHQKFHGSFISRLNLELRDDLISRLDNLDDQKKKIEYLARIIPDSLELNFKINQALDAILVEDGYLERDFLDDTTRNRNFSNDQPGLIENLFIQQAILLYPNKDLRFLTFLNQLNQAEFSSTPELEVTSTEGFKILHTYFHQNDAILKRKLLASSIEIVLREIKKDHEQEKLYHQEISIFLKGEFSESKIIQPHAEMICQTFVKLPSLVQSLLLTTLLNHNLKITPENEKSVIKESVNDLGVVAIKIGQMLAENPNTPPDYQELFQEFRSGNKPVPILDYWDQIPNSVKSEITHLGKLVGTGSIKQLHKVKVKMENNNTELVLAIIKPNVLNQTISTLNALENVQKVSGLRKKLRSLIFQELDLHLEFLAFRELESFSSTDNITLVVPSTFSESNQHLIRTFIKGDSFEDLMETQPDQVLVDKFYHFCQFILEKFFKHHVILSDLHFGNLINLDDQKISIIDPGQITQITNIEMNVLVCLLNVLDQEKIEDRLKKEKFLFDKLKFVIPELKEGDRGKFASLYLEQNEHSKIKYRFMGLINELEKNNLSVPDSFFAFGKMYDIMDSQFKLFKYPGYSVKNLLEFYKSSFVNYLTWSDIYSLKY